MVGTGFSSLKHSVAVSAILCGVLSGCASTEQHAQAGLSPAQTPAQANVPQPAAVANTSVPGVSAPATTDVAQAGVAQTQGAETALAKTGRLQPGETAPGVAQTAATQPQQATDPAALEQRMAQAGTGQLQAASQGQAAIAAATGAAAAPQTAAAAYAEPVVPSVVAIPMPNPSRPGEEAAMRPLMAAAGEPSPIPLTPEMVAIQSVIPIPRPSEGPAFEPTEVALASPVPQLAYATKPQYDFNFDTSGPTVVPAVLEYDNDASKVSPAEKTYITKLIDKYANIYQVPAALIHRVVHRESRYNPKAYSTSGYFGLMQIKYNTAKSMGYEGPASGLLDAETNIKYAAKYLRGAWMVSDNKQDEAVGLYARGYYYEAKRKGMDDIANGDY